MGQGFFLCKKALRDEGTSYHYISHGEYSYPDESLTENFGKFMTIVLAMIISPIINGFVFSKLWIWFIVPIFQVQPLRVVEAIGVVFLINFVRARKDKEADKDKFWENFATNMIFVVLMAGFALLSGWVVTLFL